ncbi:hypothetical protein KQX54_003426 [Cotesia glomerata]|uniref:Uncharacterized protein n=1 Tax=Cotesia glomerata TaxID=32391 RepID=A0AAV7HSN3_COTGL|nr:hypothetical protein KQX54_003426 [Cotesia glomerata]
MTPVEIVLEDPIGRQLIDRTDSGRRLPGASYAQEGCAAVNSTVRTCVLDSSFSILKSALEDALDDNVWNFLSEALKTDQKNLFKARLCKTLQKDSPNCRTAKRRQMQSNALTTDPCDDLTNKDLNPKNRNISQLVMIREEPVVTSLQGVVPSPSASPINPS